MSKIYRQSQRLGLAAHAEEACKNRVVNLPDAINAYEEGNYPTALQAFRQLADKGNARAQHLLGLMYDNGEGVVQDYRQAVAWYSKASAQGNADAQYNLGMMYGNGTGAQVVQSVRHVRQ